MCIINTTHSQTTRLVESAKYGFTSEEVGKWYITAEHTDAYTTRSLGLGRSGQWVFYWKKDEFAFFDTNQEAQDFYEEAMRSAKKRREKENEVHLQRERKERQRVMEARPSLPDSFNANLLLAEIFTKELCCSELGHPGGQVTRVLYAFENDRIITLLDLVEITEEEFLRIPNVGKKCLKLVKNVLARDGLVLGMNVFDPRPDHRYSR